MKVCMVNKHFYPWLGGEEKHTQQLCYKLKDNNVDVTVLTSRYQRNLPRFESINGIAIVRVPCWGRRMLFNLTCAFSFFFWLILHSKSYQILHIHAASCVSFPAVIVAKILRKRTILSIATAGKLEGDFATIQKSIFAPILFKILRYCDAYIAISEEIKQEILDYGFDNEKIFRIPNGVDVNDYRPVPSDEKEQLREMFSLPSKKIVTFVGRLIFRKGIDTLLKAWKSVISTCSSTHLVIVGNGPELKRLKVLSKTLSIGEEVSFLGRIDNVNQILQASDIFVFPSKEEGLPVAVLEAMSSALPVVATAIGGITDLIQNGTNGVLVRPESSQDLANALIKLIQDTNFAHGLGERARSTICGKYALGQIAVRYEETYKQITSLRVSRG